MPKGMTFLDVHSESFSLSGLFSAELALARGRRWAGRSDQNPPLLASLRLFIPVAQGQRDRSWASTGVSRASVIHTRSGSPPSVRETLLRNLVANSSMAWLGQSVCVMGGTAWLWGLFWQARPVATSLGGYHRLLKSSTLVFPPFPLFSRYPQGLASPVTSSHVPGLLGHHLEHFCVHVSVCHTWFFLGSPASSLS